MTSPTLAALVLAFATAPKVELSVNVKDGDVITGERTFRVSASAPNDYITRVEFYVGNDLRDQDTSTPYEFKIDSLGEEEGPLRLQFRAYSGEGGQAEKTVTVRIDNGLSQGAKFHLDAAQTALAEGKYADAITRGRIALRIDPKSVEARLILARANLNLNTFDTAQKFAEDAIEQDPKNVAARNLLAVTHLRRSFTIVTRAGQDRMASVNSIRSAMKSAVKARSEALSIEFEAVGAPTAENLITYADAAFAAGRFSATVQPLADAFRADNRRADVANRLAYAYIRLSRNDEAAKVLEEHGRFTKRDAYGDSLLAVAYAQLGRLDPVAGGDSPAQAQLKAAQQSDPNSLGYRTAAAFFALKLNRTSDLRNIVNGLVADKGPRPEVLYYLGAIQNRLGQLNEGRRVFENTVLAEPAFEEAYIERAYLSLAFANQTQDAETKNLQYEFAKAFLEAALEARPDSPEALAGIAVVSLLQNKPQEAVQFAEAAVRAAPGNAAAHYTLSGALSRLASVLARSTRPEDADRVSAINTRAQQAVTRAGELDPRQLLGRSIPREPEIVKYATEGGRPVVVTSPR